MASNDFVSKLLGYNYVDNLQLIKRKKPQLHMCIFVPTIFSTLKSEMKTIMGSAVDFIAALFVKMINLLTHLMGLESTASPRCWNCLFMVVFTIISVDGISFIG